MLDDAGRIYYSHEVSKLSPTQPMSVIERFEADGTGGVMLAYHTSPSPIAYDPETNELVLWDGTTSRLCRDGVYGELKRIEL